MVIGDPIGNCIGCRAEVLLFDGTVVHLLEGACPLPCQECGNVHRADDDSGFHHYDGPVFGRYDDPHSP